MDPPGPVSEHLFRRMAALVAVFRFKAGMIPVLAACSAAGALLHLATGVTA